MMNKEKPEIIVLRLFHRKSRDKRVTTHTILVSRAFSATKCFYSGDRDLDLENRITNIVNKWGGDFKIEYSKNWKNLLKDFKDRGYFVVHLTMYGIPIQNLLDNLKNKEKIVLVVGSEKVPKEVYNIADYNIAITNQPHSEIAAIAIFLDKIFDGKELCKDFNGAKIKIIPTERGKKVIENDNFSKNKKN